MENQPIQEIKPVVIPAQFFVLGPLASGLIALVPGLLVGAIVMMTTKIPDAQEPGYMPDTYQWGLAFSSALAASGLVFVVSMVLIGISAFKGPGRTTYTIFPDRVECCEGVWVKTRRNVAFDRVTSVEGAEGILQQTRGAGTVILVAREEGNLEDQQVPASGATKRIELANVAHPKEVYELIRTLVLQKNRPNKPAQQTGDANSGCPTSTAPPA